jgi:hypothetical protein
MATVGQVISPKELLMKQILGLSGLGLAFLLTSCGGSSSNKPTSKTSPSPPAVQAPVVATSFSNLHPTAGHRESVNVQFFEGKHRLPGGHLLVTLTYGKHSLHLKGSSTNNQGIASAAFTVPRQARGTTLQASSTILYKGRQYMGANQVTVAR